MGLPFLWDEAGIFHVHFLFGFHFIPAFYFPIRYKNTFYVSPLKEMYEKYNRDGAILYGPSFYTPYQMEAMKIDRELFNRKDNVAIGKISNMYEIMEVLSRAGHIVTP